jgi:methionyl aminopeptidase
MTARARDKRVCIHTAREIEGIREASAATATVLAQLSAAIRPGMTTLAIDQLAADLIARTGGSSAFFNYRGFPGQLCISINDEVVHGIGRGGRVIQPGDLVSLDVGVCLNGYIGDTATSIMVGPPPDQQIANLLKATRESLDAGIAAARSGNYVNAIGAAVQAVVEGYGFSVVRDFVGHGCGCQLHEPPEVANFVVRKKGPRLQPGMVLAIEPMVNVGAHEVSVDADGWTVRTSDGGWSAHFEHMVLITDGEAEVLTWPRKA